MKKVLSLLLLLIPLCSLAQEDDSEVMQVRGNIKFVNSSGQPVDGPQELVYATLDRKVALEAENKFKRVMGSDDPNKDAVISQLIEEYKITSFSRKGTFKKRVLPSMSLLFVDAEDYEVLRIDVEKGKTVYKDVLMKLKRQIDAVEKVGKLGELDIAIAATDDADDGFARFRLRIVKPAGTARSDSRLIIQPFAVNCSSEDTLAHLDAIVFEGEKYHQMQNKRMAFNYDKNDKLSKYYRRNAVLREDQRFVIDTVIVWKKPAGMTDQNFRGPYTYIFEDFHHPYFREDTDGTCLVSRPFKMLDFTAAMHQIELSTDFYVKAEDDLRKKDQKINLRFEKGTSALIQDSLNFVERDKFVKEISSYGNSLVEVTIVGGASPDGTRRRNEELALQRAGVARNMLGRISVTPRVTSQVYTWNDVTKELRAVEKNEQANKIDEIIQNGSDEMAWFHQIQGLPFYDYDIVPILEKQRAMICKYMYQNNRPLEPEECVAAFRAHKQEYLDGRRHFSTGDFYNLYDQLEDSLEIDEVTTMAYNEIKNEVDYHLDNAMAPYVFNLRAIQQMKLGKPDIEILRPFINLTRRGRIGGGQGINVEQYVPGRGKIKINRAEIIANQAACYYMQQNVDTALFLIDWLKECKLTDQGTDQLEDMINLKRLFYKRNNRTAKEEADFQRAKNNVLNMSPDNRAILYTEIEEWNGRETVMGLIDQMEDNNPKKWYLKGLMAAIRLAEKKTQEPINITSDSDDDEEADDAKDGEFYRWPKEKLDQYQIEQFDDPAKEKALMEYLKKLQAYKDEHDGQEPPLAPATDEGKKDKKAEPANHEKYNDVAQYLVYFQHAFDLDGTNKFRRFYQGEALVSEDLRKANPYKIKNRPLYREMFNVLKRRDEANARAAKLIEKEDKEEKEEKGDEEVKEVKEKKEGQE